MFDLYCHICEAVHSVGSCNVLSTHTTSEGAIAYVRCPRGHTLAVDFERLNPYSWRRDPRNRAGDGALPSPAAA